MQIATYSLGYTAPDTQPHERNWPAVRPAERMMKNQLRAQIGGLYAGAGLPHSSQSPEIPARIIQFIV